MDSQNLAEQLGGFHTVCPKTDCPHCLTENIQTAQAILQQGVTVVDPCKQCGVSGEVWLCLTCSEVHCSRYVQGHMAAHNGDTGHPIVFSFADFSFWCYLCDSYIVNPQLNHHSNTIMHIQGIYYQFLGFYQQKFGAEGSDPAAVLEKIRLSKHSAASPEN